MRSARVLIVDDDPWTQRMASSVLGQAGHFVDVASDGWEGLIRAGRATPDLVIAEIRLPTTDAWSFAHTLRLRAATADVPIIFLASGVGDRQPGPAFRADFDAILAKPFRLEDLQDGVRAALRRTGDFLSSSEMSLRVPAAPPVDLPPALPLTPAPPEERRRAVLAGSLAEFGLSSVLIVLELERKSGVLHLQQGDGTGRVFVREGRAIRAQLEGPAPRTGARAVFELLSWNTGRFDFNAGQIEGEDEIGSSTSFLLMEGARLQDERNHRNSDN